MGLGVVQVSVSRWGLRTVVSRLLPASAREWEEVTTRSPGKPEGLNGGGREEALEVENHLRACGRAAVAGRRSSETQKHRLKEASMVGN